MRVKSVPYGFDLFFGGSVSESKKERAQFVSTGSRSLFLFPTSTLERECSSFLTSTLLCSAVALMV